MKRVAKYFVFLIAALVLVSCQDNVFFDSQSAVNVHGWSPEDSVDFDVEVNDTNVVYNFLAELRTQIDYPYANTFLFIRTIFPDGSWAQDTLEFPLADETGRWMGRKIGRYVDTRYYFRRNARFPMEGVFRFSITNGMRDSAIVGIKEVGLRIEKHY